MKGIPKIIHQTWKSHILPDDLRRYRHSWKIHHPGWEYRFYDDEACRLFTKDHYPELLSLYESYPKHIQRIDIFRYLVVNRCGGVYADMDMEFFRPIDSLLDEKTCAFSIEAHLTPQRQQELGYAKPYQIGNCIFAAAANHRFFEMIIARLQQLADRPISTDADVEDTTGPRMLTRLYYQLSDAQKTGISILPQIHLLSPKIYPNIFPFNTRMYGRHHCSGTWKDRTVRISLKRLWIERNKLPFLW